jgi:hypothetical protein
MADLSNTTPAARFHNMPASLLADAIGALDAQIKALETEKDAARMALIARGSARAEGERFTVSFVTSIRQSLDTAAVKAEMGQQWFDDHSKLAEVTAMRVAVNKAALAAA